MSRTVAADKQRKSICIVLFFSTPVSGLCELHKCVWYSGFPWSDYPPNSPTLASEANTNSSFPSLFSGLILLFYAALYAFLAAMFGGCLFCLMWSISPYHPTFNDRVMPPGKKKTNQKTPPPRPSTSAFLLPVTSAQVSAQLTVWVSPLAGMTMAPHLEGHEIAFNASDRKSWKKYARSMDEYLRRESFQRNGHASSATFIPISSCNASWERKPFVG